MHNQDDYYSSKRFRSLLNEYEANEREGVPTIISSDDYIDIAEYYYDSGDMEEALHVTDTAMKLYPGATSPLAFKARIELLDKSNPEKALEYAEQIEDKTDAEYYYVIAEIMLVEERADDADEYLESRYADIDEEDKGYYEIDVATLFLDYDVAEKAEKWFRRCSNHELTEYKELKARLMMNRGEFETSKKLYKELLDVNPFSTSYWNALASSQFFSNDIEESISSSEYSIAIDPQNALALLNKANGLYNLGNYAEALTYYQRYAVLCPDDESGEMLIGLCYLMLEDYEKAVTHLSHAAEMSEPGASGLIDIYKDTAYALCRLDKVKEAMETLKKAETVEGCNRNELLVYRGSLLLGCGRYGEARKCFIAALKKSDFEPYIYMRITITLYESGELEQAYKMFQLLYSNNRKWTEGYAYFAACCYDLGRYDEFLKYLKPAVKHTPDEAKDVLGPLFPDDMNPSDYYEYIRKKL